VLLTFLGHLATATLRAQQGAALPAAGPLLDRTRRAQQDLGLGPAEIGGLLLHAWNLPEPIVDAVRAIDRMLVTPTGGPDAGMHQRLALAHLCARLGEQLASPDAPPVNAATLAGLAEAILDAEDSFHLRAHLAAPAFARLRDHLQAPDLAQPLLALQQGMKAPR
jgi:HD-like signal output (HDOD) protein